MTAASVTPLRHENTIAPPVSTVPDDTPELRYLAAVEELFDDAIEHRHVEDLVEALTWHLARIGYGFGTRAVADIVRRIGSHVCDIAEEQTATEEAERAKKAGRKPQ